MNTVRSCALALLLLAMAPAAAAEADPARVPEAFFGVNAGGPFDRSGELYSMTDAERVAVAAAMRGHGIRAVRFVIAWDRVQPNQGQSYDFSFTDRLMEILAQNDLVAQPELGGTPNWAAAPTSQLYKAAPRAGDGVQAFAAFAGAVADRYGEGGQFWAERGHLAARPIDTLEIYNEPNWVYPPATGQTPTYGTVYGAARNAIKAADPSIAVLVGGLAADRSGDITTSVTPEAFLAREFPSPAGVVDAVALHSYSVNAVSNWQPHTNGYGDFPNTVTPIATLRTWMRSAGLGDEPIYFNEWGWQAHHTYNGVPKGLPESMRSALFSDVASLLARSNCGLAVVSPYVWQGFKGAGDMNRRPEPEHDNDWFSLASFTNPFPTGVAYGQEITRFATGDATAPRAAFDLCGPTPADSDDDDVLDPYDFAPHDEGVSAAPVPAAPTVDDFPRIHDAPSLVGPLSATGGLHANTGTFNGSPVAVPAVSAWLKCDSAGNACQTIAGATGTQLPLAPAMAGSTIRVRVAATNTQGTGTAESAEVTLAAPSQTTPPVIEGPPRAGQKVAAGSLKWVGYPRPVLTYRWSTCVLLMPCTPDDSVNGAGKRYLIPCSAVGKQLIVTVTGQNALGSTAGAPSARSPIVEYDAVECGRVAPPP